jgi:secreted Zn-dependent insulinase-like peptidase
MYGRAYSEYFSVVGSLNDFEGIPGLANLVGYTLMKRSKKYPRVDDFKRFVEDRGGRQFQETDLDMQTFGFEINADYFVSALDRYANLFLSFARYN